MHRSNRGTTTMVLRNRKSRKRAHHSSKVPRKMSIGVPLKGGRRLRRRLNRKG
jgi:hypothetical protein